MNQLPRVRAVAPVMRFTWDRDTRTLCIGAAMALTCGLMLGGAMRPDLTDDGRPSGPQQLSAFGAERATGADAAAPVSYAGPVPDYVLGTDWKRMTSAPAEPAAVSPPAAQRVALQADDETPGDGDASAGAWDPQARPVAYDERRPAPLRRYPSEGGGTGLDPQDEAPDPSAGG